MELRRELGKSSRLLLDSSSKKKTRTEPRKEKNILCKNCSQIITTDRHKLEVNGSFKHKFTNPAGIVFLIGCFYPADGCFTNGELTGEYTWFEGYEWCFAHCSRCFRQLGWFYLSGRGAFYGLILDHLMEVEKNFVDH